MKGKERACSNRKYYEVENGIAEKGFCKSLADISKSLYMDKSTVSRTLNLFFASSSLKKKPYAKDMALCKLPTPCQLLIMNLVMESYNLNFLLINGTNTMHSTEHTQERIQG